MNRTFLSLVNQFAFIATDQRQNAFFRMAFFVVLGVHAWFSVAHAPRYGAGGFNVSHLAFWPEILSSPTRPAMLYLLVGTSFLAFATAMGRARRHVIALLFGGFSLGYFSSQLNSFQHEYFLCWVLGLLIFFPWEPTAEKRSVVPRLLLLQISFVYFWAAISKFDPGWLSGQTLALQIQDGPLFYLSQWVQKPAHGEGLKLGAELGWFDTALPKLIIATELFLAIALQVKKLRPVAFWVGVLFHIGIELQGLQIGLFSYFMLSLYILVAPSGWFEKKSLQFICGTGIRAPASRRVISKSTFIAAALLGCTFALIALSPFHESLGLAIMVLALSVLLLVGENWLLSAIRCVASATVLVLLMHFSQTTADYFRFWGGSSLRLGNDRDAERAYRALHQFDSSKWPSYEQRFKKQKN